jgi:YD repeat-containing protein
LARAGSLTDTYRINQSPTEVALLSNAEDGDDYRQIFLDGRELPKDPNPTWRRYSIGHWEGDTLEVETAGFNDRSWLDMVDRPHSERLHVTERFQRIDFGHMDCQVTFDDPETMTRPLSIREVINYTPDTDMLEGVSENERDAPRLVGQTASQAVQVSAAILVNYAGTYELRDALPGLPPGFPPPYTVALANGQLYVGALQLIPQSETRFQEFDGGVVEFSYDASGAITGVTRTIGDGQSGFFRKR